MLDLASPHLTVAPVITTSPTEDDRPWSAATSPQGDALWQMRNLMALPHKSVVTFDVFDTFLFRLCRAPDGVFERAFRNLPANIARPGLAESFVQNRILAELRAREKAVAARASAEVTIEEIYQRLPRQALGLQDISIDDLVHAELQAEIDLCRVNPDMLALVREARDRPVPLRLGFVSDTYWSAAQLQRILRHCAPELVPDFIYTSADHRTCKTATLFDRVIQGEGHDVADAIHIGDNPVADILGAQAFGIATVHYPQPQEAIASLLAREGLAAQLLQAKRPDFSTRLDEGFHLIRRAVLPQLEGLTIEQRDTAAILGPALAGFQLFINARVDAITRAGGKPAILFLGRDGFLPFELWQETQDRPAHYVEINRRVALIANLRAIRPLQDIFEVCIAINEASVQAFLKLDPPAISRYFATCPDGISDGKSFAKALPDLLSGPDIAALADAMRDDLLTYLRRTVPDLDSFSDLILVDLGYSGTIQRAVRDLFDRSSLRHRLHGVYLATVDDSLVDLPDGDSASGFLDSSVIPPASKLFLLRNIAILEQVFSAPHGSVRQYRDGLAERETEIRSSAQLAICAGLQAAIRQFARLFAGTAKTLDISLTGRMPLLRDWSAILILRLLAFPSLAEQQLFGALRHDVNLGTYLLYDMINTDHIERLALAGGLTAALQAEAPPMWLAGSLTALSALQGAAYGFNAFGLTTTSLIEDQPATHWQAKIIKDGVGVTCAVSGLVTATGELRLRIPVLKRHTGGVLALPLAGFLQSGLIRGMTLQGGTTSANALASDEIERLAPDQLRALHCRLDGMQFTAGDAEAHLLITMPPKTAAVTILTLTILPLPPVA